MDNIMIMDELEAFMLDFLAFRRERARKAAQTRVQAPQLLLPEKRIPEKKTEPAEIGKGWPHYRGILSGGRDSPSQYAAAANPEPVIGHVPENEIISALLPILSEMFRKFGVPANKKDTTHIMHQVIAKAMSLPPVAESMSAGEMNTWGRVPLLQTVTELLILLQIERNNKSCAAY